MHSIARLGLSVAFLFFLKLLFFHGDYVPKGIGHGEGALQDS